MAKNNNLSDFLTDIANAIRTKKGSSGIINAQDFSDEILSIPDEYYYYAKSYYTITNNSTLFPNAWEHSLTVDPTEIERGSSVSTQYGRLQYPNGGTEGVIIPQGVASIGNYAFYTWQSNNHPLVIPNSVTSIGNYVFFDWQSNNHPLVIPNSVTSIGTGAFYGWVANNYPLIISNSVTSIGTAAFRNWQSNNHPLIIPNSVKNIGDGAFYGWVANNHPLVIPNSVTSIGYEAFGRWISNNQPLIIPNSVTSIGTGAFRNWEQVPYVIMEGETPPTLEGSTAFDNQNNAPIYVPDSAVYDYKNATNWSALASRIFPISEK